MNNLDDAPVAANIASVTMQEDSSVTINVLSLATDVDNATLSISGTPTAAHGTVAVNPDGTLTYTPTANYNGTDVITYAITDGQKAATGTIQMTIFPVNDAPVAVDDTAATAEDSAKVINVLANDTDVDNATLTGAEAGHGTVSVITSGIPCGQAAEHAERQLQRHRHHRRMRTSTARSSSATRSATAMAALPAPTSPSMWVR